MKILLIIAIIIAYYIIKTFILRLYYLHTFSKTYDELDNIGLINTVSGKIGAGKSILCSMYTQLLTFKIIDKLQDIMDEVERILIDVDFTLIEKLISDLYITIDNLDNNFEILLKDFKYLDDNKKTKYFFNLDKTYFDSINYKDRIKLLKRWIECYLHLQRNSYVFANVRVFNHITKSYSFPFENEWIHLKITDEFPLVKNSILFEDDKSLYSSNISFMKKMHEDSGSDTFMRLFRHLFEELSYYIVSLQDVDRWLKHEREISTSHTYVFKTKIVGEYKFLNFLLNFIEKFFNIILWILKRFYKNERYYNNNNFFKRINYRLDLFRKKLFSKTYLKSYCGVYDDIEKVGKDIKKEDHNSYYFNYVAPIYYFFGNLNSHEFHAVYNYVYYNSKKKYKDLTEFLFDIEKVEKVLGKDLSAINNSDNQNIF